MSELDVQARLWRPSIPKRILQPAALASLLALLTACASMGTGSNTSHAAPSGGPAVMTSEVVTVRPTPVDSKVAVTCYGPPQNVVLTKKGHEFKVQVAGQTPFDINFTQENVYQEIQPKFTDQVMGALTALRIQCQQYAEGFISRDTYGRKVQQLVDVMAGLNKSLPPEVTGSVTESATPPLALSRDIQTMVTGTGLVRRTQHITYQLSEEPRGHLKISTTETAELENTTGDEAQYAPYITVDKRVQETPNFFVGGERLTCEESQNVTRHLTEFECPSRIIPPHSSLQIETTMEYAPTPLPGRLQIAFADTDHSRTLITHGSMLEIKYPRELSKKLAITVQALVTDARTRVTPSTTESHGMTKSTFEIKGPVLPYQGYFIKITTK